MAALAAGFAELDIKENSGFPGRMGLPGCKVEMVFDSGSK